jgi:uncharacterized membrane protein
VPDAKPDAGVGENELAAPEVITGEIAPEDRRVVAAAEFSGPLPPPNVLSEYERVKPGLSDIIVDQWQRETAHRHRTIDGLAETDREAMRTYYSLEKRGQWLGFAAFTLIVALSLAALLLDRSVEAISGLAIAGAYAVWALRRESSPSSTVVPVDLDDGDQVESRDTT